MKRRAFLRLAALGPAVLAGCSSASRDASAGKRVIVIGAGLAGLAAAHELAQAGYDVAVIEARGRPGGRVETLREPFDDGQHAEAGALFVPAAHVLTLRYARQFGLGLQPALPLFEARLFYLRGRRVTGGARADWPFALRSDERAIGYSSLWDKYVDKPIAGLADEALDRMSVAELLRQQGASAEAIALLRIGFLDMMGEGIESYSALQLKQRLASAGSTYTVRGGTDLLPRAFAAKLEGRIRYGSPVVRLERAQTSVTVLTGGERLSADHVVCTLPAPVLGELDVTPRFSAEKAAALRDLRYTSVVRVLLQFRRKAWTAEHLHILATTDLPLQWIFEHTVHQPGPRGILEAQALGSHARRLGRMAESERIAFALSQLERVFPGIGAQYERGNSKSWDDDPWARGAFAYFAPGQALGLREELARPEGRVHFAGDHTSTASGWMQGALESGLRAAREVSHAA